ncbi:nucleolar protein [Hanseniaspora osmophila]|uniref:Ribosome biogenesis protein 15 n=1 Tax=Hanseniaspora osmophila TaxID=56408 RepID=A0A1E5RMZ9_9ASCO|nr:Ribosome biogenesis protein 15 [Hanseniaspora osmophila]
MSTENKELIKGFEDESKNAQDQKHTIKKLNHKNKSSSTSKKQESSGKKTKKAKQDDDLSSIIYISRLPKGFHEKELSKYFSQFGDLKQVKLARNKKTGNSRHYGFVEFVSKYDAQVAQETMNNYLLMGHLLKVEILRNSEDNEAQISKLKKYKRMIYKEDPIKKTANALKEQSNKKHSERLSSLKEQGIDFEF